MICAMDVIEKQRAAIEMLLRNQDRASVVPIRDNFSGDNRLSLGVFARIPDDIAEEIARVQNLLRSVAPHFHYAPRQSLHLTVQNVRTIASPPTFTREDAHRVAEMVRTLAPKFPPQCVHAEGVIALPTSVLVTVLYPPSMHDLIAALSAGINELGLPDDKLYVDATTRFGNITICRFTAPPTKEFLEVVRGLRNEEIADIAIPALQVAITNAVFDLAYTESLGDFELGTAASS